VSPELLGIRFPGGTEMLAQEESASMTDRVEFILSVGFSLETGTIASDATSHSIPNMLRLLPVSKS
jgi:hypothetical protein